MQRVVVLILGVAPEPLHLLYKILLGLLQLLQWVVFIL
jgi:hypothetical protein